MNQITPFAAGRDLGSDRSTPGGPRVLVIDDDPDAAAITIHLLSRGGNYRAVHASSASEAYALLGIAGQPRQASDWKQGFDLLIMDLQMPGTDGIEATAMIRTHSRGRRIPILMLSGRRDNRALNQAFMAGANDFVFKPIEAIELQARVRTLLRLKREQDRRIAREHQLERSNRDLRVGLVESSLLDPVTRLPTGEMAEVLLRDCQTARRPIAGALIRIEEFDAYCDHHGIVGGDDLMITLAMRFARLPAALGTTLLRVGERSFGLLHPGAPDCASLETLCERMERAVTDDPIPHGNALHDAHVRISTAALWSEGEECAALADRLVMELDVDRDDDARVPIEDTTSLGSLG